MRKARTAGQALRAPLDADLAARGPGWEWTAFDLEVVESAVRHADAPPSCNARMTGSWLGVTVCVGVGAAGC